MLYHGSYVRIADNSGGKYALCIKLLGYYKHNSFGSIGDILVVVLKKCRFESTLVFRHKVYYSLVLRTKVNFYRNDFFKFNFNCNDVILLDSKKKPLARRIIGVVPRELRDLGWSRLVAISEAVI